MRKRLWNIISKSATAISQNQNQKGRSFLALANYYFDKPDFIRSGMYYDSTVYFLDPSFPEYKEIQNKSQNLNALVSQLNIIQREDSLQKVARMNESERNALIASLIAKVTKEETERKVAEYTDSIILDSFMRMKDVFREILNRKENGIFIISRL